MRVQSGEQPIGIFDSGIGGLTVLRALVEAFPNERFIYVGDTARLPYGNKSPETIRNYVEQIMTFLLKYRVKALVIACNSASSVLVESESWNSVPLYNVINLGASEAVKVTRSQRVGVIGTRATISSQAYAKALRALEPGTQVYQQACPLLVPLVEEGWEQDPLTNLVVYRYLKGLKDSNVDTLILGCTHYPVLRESIENVMGSAVQLVDSSRAIVDLMVDHMLREKVLPCDIAEPRGPRFQLMTTDVNENFKHVAQRLMSPYEVESLTHIHLGPDGSL